MILADLIWPGLLLAGRSLWIIGAGLAIEWFFVYMICETRLGKAFIINLIMNIASCLMGFLLIPIVGFLWELSLIQTLLHHFFQWGTFSYTVWGMTALLAALGNNFLEYYIMTRFLTIKKITTGFGWLYLANVISVSAALISLIMSPPN